MSNEITPIVVGVDGSDDSLRALDWAAGVAHRHRAPLVLVHAYQPFAAPLPAVYASLPAPIEETERILAEALNRVGISFPDVDVSVVQREGPAPHVLVRESENARLLVVGREGLGRLAELVLGSVSLACASRARVPVAVIPAAWTAPAAPYGRIVVGVDGSDHCQKAVRYAFELAQERGAELLAVYAWHQPSRWPEGWPLTAATPRFADEYEKVVAGATDELRQKHPDVSLRTAVDVGHPADVLAREAREADLVVIGGRGHGTVTGMLLGSVARAILRYVDRPVVVVNQ